MIFIDSGAFIALAVQRDQYHERAVAFHRSTHARRWTLDSVVGETYTHLRYRFGRNVALSFLHNIEILRGGGHLRIAYVDESMSAVALAILKQYSDVDLSYVDASALAWLRTQPKITRVFGFDDHWRLEGHLLVPG